MPTCWTMPPLHGDDPVGQGHRLDLVVRDVDRGGAERLVQLLDLAAHLLAQAGVEVRQRLVEQEGLGRAHDGAAHGDALALAAGERARPAFEQGVEAELCRGAGDGGGDALLRRAAQPQAVAHVLGDASCADRARRTGTPWRCRGPWAPGRSRRRPSMRISPAEISSSPAIMRSSVDLPQPEGPTSTTNSPSRDREVDAVEHVDRAVGLADFGDVDGCHAMLLSPSPRRPSGPARDTAG